MQQHGALLGGQEVKVSIMTKIMEADGIDVNMLFPTPEEDSGEDGTEETAFECAAETGQQPGWLAAPAD